MVPTLQRLCKNPVGWVEERNPASAAFTVFSAWEPVRDAPASRARRLTAGAAWDTLPRWGLVQLHRSLATEKSMGCRAGIGIGIAVEIDSEIDAEIDSDSDSDNEAACLSYFGAGGLGASGPTPQRRNENNREGNAR